MATFIYHKCTNCHKEKPANQTQLCDECKRKAIRQQNHNRIKPPTTVTRWKTTGKDWKEA